MGWQPNGSPTKPRFLLHKSYHRSQWVSLTRINGGGCFYNTIIVLFFFFAMTPRLQPLKNCSSVNQYLVLPFVGLRHRGSPALGSNQSCPVVPPLQYSLPKLTPATNWHPHGAKCWRYFPRNRKPWLRRGGMQSIAHLIWRKKSIIPWHIAALTK